VGKEEHCTARYSSFMNFSVPRERNFTAANFDALPRAEKLVFYHEIFVMKSSLC